jgi:uncharacterized membrane protein
MKISKEIIARFTSRKFLLAVFGVIVILLQAAGASISEDQRTAIIQLIMAFTVAEGVADAVGRYASK